MYFGAPVEMGIGMRGVQKKECAFVAPCRLVVGMGACKESVIGAPVEIGSEEEEKGCPKSVQCPRRYW